MLTSNNTFIRSNVYRLKDNSWLRQCFNKLQVHLPDGSTRQMWADIVNFFFNSIIREDIFDTQKIFTGGFQTQPKIVEAILSENLQLLQGVRIQEIEDQPDYLDPFVVTPGFFEILKNVMPEQETAARTTPVPVTIGRTRTSAENTCQDQFVFLFGDIDSYFNHYMNPLQIVNERNIVDVRDGSLPAACKDLIEIFQTSVWPITMTKSLISKNCLLPFRSPPFISLMSKCQLRDKSINGVYEIKKRSWGNSWKMKQSGYETVYEHVGDRKLLLIHSSNNGLLLQHDTMKLMECRFEEDSLDWSGVNPCRLEFLSLNFIICPITLIDITLESKISHHFYCDLTVRPKDRSGRELEFPGLGRYQNMNNDVTTWRKKCVFGLPIYESDDGLTKMKLKQCENGIYWVLYQQVLSSEIILATSNSSSPCPAQAQFTDNLEDGVPSTWQNATGDSNIEVFCSMHYYSESDSENSVVWEEDWDSESSQNLLAEISEVSYLTDLINELSISNIYWALTVITFTGNRF